jgi:hypothetical protein
LKRPIARTLLEASLAKRIESGLDFTFMDLWLPPLRHEIDAYRPADRLIQRYRKAGWIAYRREKGRVIWGMTEAAYAFLAQEANHDA